MALNVRFWIEPWSEALFISAPGRKEGCSRAE